MGVLDLNKGDVVIVILRLDRAALVSPSIYRRHFSIGPLGRRRNAVNQRNNGRKKDGCQQSSKNHLADPKRRTLFTHSEWNASQ